MPFDAWILLAFCVGIGLGVEVVFYRAQRARREEASARTGDAAPVGDP